MKNIHRLPTDKPSRLFENTDGGLSIDDELQPNGIMCQNQNIYITSDEEIKPSDYYLWKENEVIKANDIEISFHPTVIIDCKKIILTTDQDLIGVQAIDDEFLEWFVKNPSCQEVEIREIEDELISPKNPKIRFNALQDPPIFISAESLNDMILTYKYKIIIPKEEPKQDLEKEMFELEEQLDIPSHLRWHNSKPKQETLEQKQETLEQMINILPKKYAENLDLFLKGMQYQKDQDKNKYSEEEAMELFIEGYKQRAKLSKKIFDNYSRKYAIALFKKFKKK